MNNWYCTFHYPRDWIEVVHQPGADGANGSASVPDRVRLAVERSCGDDPTAPREQLAAEVIPLVEQDADRLAAVSAHGFHDEQGRPVHMHLTLWVEERSHPASVDAELTLLATTVREAGVKLAPPEVSDVALPAGRALRVRQLENVARNGSGRTEMVDSVDYWLPVEGSNDMLWIHLWTANLAATDAAIPLFDRIAEALVVETGA